MNNKNIQILIQEIISSVVLEIDQNYNILLEEENPVSGKEPAETEIGFIGQKISFVKNFWGFDLDFLTYEQIGVIASGIASVTEAIEAFLQIIALFKEKTGMLENADVKSITFWSNADFWQSIFYGIAAVSFWAASNKRMGASKNQLRILAGIMFLLSGLQFAMMLSTNKKIEAVLNTFIEAIDNPGQLVKLSRVGLEFLDPNSSYINPSIDAFNKKSTTFKLEFENGDFKLKRKSDDEVVETVQGLDDSELRDYNSSMEEFDKTIASELKSTPPAGNNQFAESLNTLFENTRSSSYSVNDDTLAEIRKYFLVTDSSGNFKLTKSGEDMYNKVGPLLPFKVTQSQFADMVIASQDKSKIEAYTTAVTELSEQALANRNARKENNNILYSLGENAEKAGAAKMADSIPDVMPGSKYFKETMQSFATWQKKFEVLDDEAKRSVDYRPALARTQSQLRTVNRSLTQKLTERPLQIKLEIKSPVDDFVLDTDLTIEITGVDFDGYMTYKVTGSAADASQNARNAEKAYESARNAAINPAAPSAQGISSIDEALIEFSAGRWQWKDSAADWKASGDNAAAETTYQNTINQLNSLIKEKNDAIASEWIMNNKGGGVIDGKKFEETHAWFKREIGQLSGSNKKNLEQLRLTYGTEGVNPFKKQESGNTARVVTLAIMGVMARRAVEAEIITPTQSDGSVGWFAAGKSSDVLTTYKDNGSAIEVEYYEYVNAIANQDENIYYDLESETGMGDTGSYD